MSPPTPPPTHTCTYTVAEPLTHNFVCIVVTCSHLRFLKKFVCGKLQIVTIVVTEYSIKFPKAMDSITAAFGWCNFGVFTLFRQGCKVRSAYVCFCGRWSFVWQLPCSESAVCHFPCALRVTFHIGLKGCMAPVVQAANLDHFDLLMIVTLIPLGLVAALGLMHVFASELLAAQWRGVIQRCLGGCKGRPPLHPGNWPPVLWLQPQPAAIILLRARIVKAAVVLMFLVYPSVSTEIAKSFRCVLRADVSCRDVLLPGLRYSHLRKCVMCPLSYWDHSSVCKLAMLSGVCCPQMLKLW
jgi:hypothetical protein